MQHFGSPPLIPFLPGRLAFTARPSRVLGQAAPCNGEALFPRVQGVVLLLLESARLGLRLCQFQLFDLFPFGGRVFYSAAISLDVSI